MNKIESFVVPSFMKVRDWFNSDSKGEKKPVYLLGQGWFAKGFLEHIDKSKYHITNIYRNEFVNTPMLLQTVKTDSNKSSSINKFVSNADKCILDSVVSINLHSKQFSTVSGNTHSWDKGYLVCGLGSNTDIGRFWTDKIAQLKKTKPNSNICIVGAGPTGTELGFHLSDLGHKITLYDGMEMDKLYTFLTPDGKLTILESLKSKSIELVPGKMFGSEDKAKFDDVIFAVGSRPNDLMANWTITSKLNLVTNPEVFVGGDCIPLAKAVPSCNSNGIDQPSLDNQIQLVKSYPRTAQVAYQQGAYVASRLNNLNSTNKDFVFIPKGVALYKGSNSYYVEIDGLKLSVPKIFVELYYSWFK